MNPETPEPSDFDAMDLDIAAGLVDRDAVIDDFRRASRRLWAVAQLQLPESAQARIAETIEHPGWNVRLIWYAANPQRLDIRLVTPTEEPLPDDPGSVIILQVQFD